MKVAYCDMVTWEGTCANGRHYYAHIGFGDERIEVVHPITATEAKSLNRHDGICTYDEGEESGRFFSEKDLKGWAIQCCEVAFPDVELLVYGSYRVAEPQPILFGPSDVVEEINQMFARGEEIGFYDGGHESEWDDIVERWSKKYDYWRN